MLLCFFIFVLLRVKRIPVLFDLFFQTLFFQLFAQLQGSLGLLLLRLLQTLRQRLPLLHLFLERTLPTLEPAVAD